MSKNDPNDPNDNFELAKIDLENARHANEITGDAADLAIKLAKNICDPKHTVEAFVTPTDERGVDVTWSRNGSALSLIVTDSYRVDWEVSRMVDGDENDYITERYVSNGTEKHVDKLTAYYKKAIFGLEEI